MLNASRRFRYTLDLKKEEEKKQILRKIRAHAQAIRVRLFQLDFLYYVHVTNVKCTDYSFCLLGSISFQISWGRAGWPSEW